MGTTLDRIARRNARRRPEAAALVMRGRGRSWRELDARVDRLAGAFAAAGLVPGDRVAVLLGNCPEYLEIYLGAARAGVAAVPLNYRLTPPELARILEHAEPALFIVGAEYLDCARALEPLYPPLERRWLVGGGELAGARGYEAMLAEAPAGPVEAPGDEQDTFAVFYTSGTTGAPKGAMVSHRNLVMNAYNQMHADASRDDDVNLVATPLYHLGAVFMAVTYIMLGCTQVILPRFEPRAWLETLAASRATVSLLIPTMINAILNDPGCDEYELGSLRLLFYGGGPMPPAVLERAMRRFGCAFTQGYGLTETLEATFLTAADHVLDGDERQRRRLASAGREAVGAEVRVVDEAGVDRAAGEVGEILVRSDSVIRGYWRAPEETAAAIRDGWFRTGDLGYFDEDRYLYVVDRKKDMVVSGGVNVYTKEVEEVLYRHPAVLEAAVIGLPDEAWGEVVTAVVVRRPGTCVSADELIAHCRAALAGFKKPRRVLFVDELPKNASGKILKRELRRTLAGSAA